MSIQIFSPRWEEVIVNFLQLFIPIIYPSKVVFFLCACVQNVFESAQVFATQMECSPSIRQRKHKVKEILFCSSIREKHLAASWWEGEKRRGGECKEDKECVRGDLSVLGFMVFFFPESVNFAQPAELDHRCAQSAELDFKVNCYLSHGHKIKPFAKKNIYI